MHQGEGGCCPPENVPLDVDVVLGQVDADLHVVGAALLRGVCVDVQQVDLDGTMEVIAGILWNPIIVRFGIQRGNIFYVNCRRYISH